MSIEIPERLLLKVENWQHEISESKNSQPEVEKELEAIRIGFWRIIQRTYSIQKKTGKPSFASHVTEYHSEYGVADAIIAQLADASDNQNALTASEIAFTLRRFDKIITTKAVTRYLRVAENILGTLGLRLVKMTAWRKTHRKLLEKIPAYRIAWSDKPVTTTQKSVTKAPTRVSKKVFKRTVRRAPPTNTPTTSHRPGSGRPGPTPAAEAVKSRTSGTDDEKDYRNINF